jgi:hypothetical protein
MKVPGIKQLSGATDALRITRCFPAAQKSYDEIRLRLMVASGRKTDSPTANATAAVLMAFLSRIFFERNEHGSNHPFGEQSRWQR